MTQLFQATKRDVHLTAIHLAVVLASSAFLAILYLAWPWREWKFVDWPWQWLEWCSPLYDLALLETKYRLIGSLFLIPILYATVAFGRRGALVVSSLSLAATLPISSGFWNSFDSWLTNAILLLLPAIVVLVITVELELRRRDRRYFAERERDRQIYLSKIIEAQEKERERLAQELHDESIQTLLAVASHAEALECADEQDVVEMRRKAGWIKETIRGTVEDLRSMSLDLRPGILDNLGLIPALRWLVDSTNEECNVRTEIDIRGVEQKLSPQVELTAFRLVQEALSNVRRHSRAKKAVVELRFDAGSLKISIRDDGQGFKVPAKPIAFVAKGKLGLIGMQQRVRPLGGTLEIRSKPGGGTSVSIEIPLREAVGTQPG